ncbi:MAG: hypothetical protein U0Q16_27545 [Bryobacteraceae bacterium]
MRSFIAVAACVPLFAAGPTVLLLTTDGKTVEGVTDRKSIAVKVKGTRREIALSRVLSIHSGAAASAAESEKIRTGIDAILANDKLPKDAGARVERDKAVEEITAIGIPAVTPLLEVYKDTDSHQPYPLYRLFERVMPSLADQIDRSLSMVRLVGGEMLRGELEAADWKVGSETISGANVRRVAVLQKAVSRQTDLHSLLHCNQVEFLDSGIVLAGGSKVDSTALGFTRLSWKVDDWATDADGLKKPAANYKTNLVNGHPFGAVVGRVGAAGSLFLAGSHMTGKTGLGAGRLYFAVNDNPHWQNNLGSYRLTVRVTDAYDLGDAR